MNMLEVVAIVEFRKPVGHPVADLKCQTLRAHTLELRVV